MLLNNRINNHLYNICTFFLIGIIPASFVIIWCMMNTQLPVADGSDFIGSAGNLYKIYHNKGVLSFLHSVYIDRGWRPIIFPVFMMPFMIIFKGNLFISYAAVSALSIFIGAIYTFLILNTLLPRGFSFIGACVIGSLPPLLSLGLETFFSEVALYPVLLMFVYHYIKSDGLTNRKHSLIMAIAISLALMLRPIEAVYHLAMPLVIISIYLLKRHSITRREIKAAFIISILAVIVLLSHGISLSMRMNQVGNKDPFMGHLYVQAYLAIISLFILFLIITNISYLKGCVSSYINKEKNNACNYFIPVVLFITIIPVLWWYPYLQRLVEWTYQCSIGGTAQGSLTKQAPVRVLYAYFTSGGLFNLLLMTVALLISFVTVKKSLIKEIVKTPIFYIPASIIPLPLLISMFTVQTTMRKTALILPFMFMCMMFVFLQKGKLLYVRVSLLALAAIIQLGVLCYLFFGYYTGEKNQYTNIIAYAGGGAFSRPVTYRPNPHDVTLKFLSDNAYKYKIKSIAAQLLTDSNVSVDPFLLSMMANVTVDDFTIGYPYYDKFDKKNEKDTYRRFDALLLINPFGKMQPSRQLAKQLLFERDKRIPPWDKITYDMLYNYASNRINDLGWKKGPCYIFTKEKQYEGCLFLKK